MFFISSSSFCFMSLSSMSAVMVLCSSSLLGAWCYMEMSFLMAMPILIGDSCSESESSFKYFIIQSIGSSLLLMGFCFSMSSSGSMISVSVSLVGLMVKLGFFPFHLWVPSVVAFSSWPGVFFLLVVQKLGPYWLISGAGLPKEVFTICLVIGVITSVVGSLGGLNQIFLRPLLGYSSLSHSGWLISLSVLNLNMFLWYFFLYSILILAICYINLMSSSVESRLSTGVMLLSLGGAPPLAGSFIKMKALMCLTEFSSALVFFLVLSAVISMCYYVWYLTHLMIFASVNFDMRGLPQVLFVLMFQLLSGPTLFFWTSA